MACISAVAALSFFFIRPRPSYLPPQKIDKEAERLGVWKSLLATLQLATDLRMLRLLPFFAVFGFSQAYFYGMVTARQRLSLTIQSLLIAGLGNVLGSALFGRLSDKLSRKVVIYIILCTLSVAVTLSMVAIKQGGIAADRNNDQDDDDQHGTTSDALFRLAFFLFGLSEGGLHTQPRCVVSVLFPQSLERAFSMLMLTLALSLCTGFFYGPILAFEAQASVIFVLCLLSFLGIISLGSLNVDPNSDQPLAKDIWPTRGALVTAV